MFTTCLLAAMALAADPRSASPTTDPLIPICEIASIDDQAVPGVDAGVLMILSVKEGMLVKKDEEIGRVDDSEAQANLNVKKLEYDVANQTATSMIEIKHAEAAAGVAEKAFQMLEESNVKFKGTVTSIEMLKYELEWTRSKLAIEQAKEKKIEAGLTARAKLAEAGVAEVALERRKLRAPFDGMVVKVAKKRGEWVAPGEPVVHIVGVNRLRVMGNLDASDWGPTDIEGKDVTVEVTLPRGRTIKVPGRVTFVSPVVTLGQLPVWAEITAPMEGGLPVVRAGLKASMIVHASRPAKPATTLAAPSKPPLTAPAALKSPAISPAPAKSSAPTGTPAKTSAVPGTPAKSSALPGTPARQAPTTPTKSTGKN